MGPHALARVDVPRLHFADVIRAGSHREGVRRADVSLARPVRHRLAAHRLAEVFVGRDVDHARPGAEGNRRPVLPAPQRRAKRRFPGAAGLVLRIDVRPPGFRIEAPEHRLVHVGLAFHEVDRPVRALEEPEVAVARDVDQALDRPSVPLIVHENRRRHFIPVPRIVRMVLMMSLDRARRDVDGDRRAGIEVVAGPKVAHPRPAVAGSPEREIRLRIVVRGHPDRAAAGFPLIALRPGLAAGFAWRGHRVGAPEFLAGVGVEGRHKPAHSQFSSGRAHEDLAVGHERRERHVIAVSVLRDFRGPHFPAGSRVERDKHGLSGGEEHLVAEQRDTAAGAVQHHRILRRLPPIPPQHRAGSSVGRNHLIAGSRDEHHAAADNRRRLMSARHARRHRPHRLKPGDIGGGDFLQRAEAPPVIRASHHRPVAVGRRLQLIHRECRIVLQNRRPRRLRLLRDHRVRDDEDNYGCDSIFHRIPQRPLRPQRWRFTHCDSNPTRDVNGLATTSLPSVTVNGNDGNARGAGPLATRPESFGSNFE